MPSSTTASRAFLPSVDRLLRQAEAQALIARFGRQAVTDAIRAILAQLRAETDLEDNSGISSDDDILRRVAKQLEQQSRPSLRRVFNLTGTVLHTNLGRALLPDIAIEAVAEAARESTNLEFDLASGKRGERDDHLEAQLCRLTGAEAATVVNNNAAAVLLVLNSIANRKEVPTSRGELIEIGGSFRLPDIMQRSGCHLREVGTTNRTHLRDYEQAIGPKTGLVMKVHTSNYEIVGFTAGVSEAALADLCHDRGVPLAVDLGSGSLVDLRKFDLPHEPTPNQTLVNGADVVTFSGDKLLGGPQAGLIVGRGDIIARIKRNPLKRALRVDKMTIAALTSVLNLYAAPERLAERLPTMRLLTRPLPDIASMAARLCPLLVTTLQGVATVETTACQSQIGSGALPTQTIPSSGIAMRPMAGRRGAGGALDRLATAFRSLPIPVIGRIQDGQFVLDLRCLEDEAAFVNQLRELRPLCTQPR
jgi:L-seryl-tRNA(Ser) seleniumtransferase